ncbi:MAG TPA: xanthine dehydrogenase family protein subunit M [Acidimicrobiales bacterium]|nr:xanthine dehydrogenase family protein subunit M [Acidimicrobiales bacterium]
MKPAPFGYHRVSSVEEAVAALSAYEGTARPIAGGQSLVPMLNMRLLRPDALIDINPVRSLRRVDVDGATGAVTIGATSRYSTIETSGVIAERLPLLARVVRHVGDRQVRNRGTVGGSLSHGDPTAEVPLACLTLGGRVRVQGPDGVRHIRMEDLYETSYASVLAPCEVLTDVVLPEAPAHSGFLECCRRHNDFAVVSVACVGDRDRSGRWSRIRIGLGGVADTPVLAANAAGYLEGSRLTDEEIREAAQATLAVIDPPSDVRASAEYRRHLVPVYVRRALTAMRDGADHGRDASSSDGAGR